MAVLDKLTHKIDITEVASIDYTGQPITGITTWAVPCYITPKTKRFLEKGEEIQTNTQIIFKGDAILGFNWFVTNGVDVLGETLISTAVITNLELISHPLLGMRVKIAYVDLS